MNDIEAIGNKVLIVTGGYLTEEERSFFYFLKKIFLQGSASRHAWLDIKLKLVVVELLISSKLAFFSNWVANGFKKNKYSYYFGKTDGQLIPDLSEVILTTLLKKSGIHFEVITYHALITKPKLANKLLNSTNCVFASTTLLHDLSELDPLLKLLNRDHNKIVVGGALLGALPVDWDGNPGIDIVAIGYGETLVPVLAEWIKSNYKYLPKPLQGRIEERKNATFLYSGTSDSKNLDWLVRPDWKLTSNIHNRDFDTIYYESVRGCPYRCSFCNYPFLFDDYKFRFKSAEKIAEDWTWYCENTNVNTIICLDSLFTVPKSRVIQLCDILIEKKLNLKWVCYARADDLVDESLVILLKKAGLIQVQIGIESGDQKVLDAMNKQCDISDNIQAIRNCKKHKITTAISLIVGHPEESVDSLENTMHFLSEAKPDFYYLATFSTRVESAPILSVENKDRYGLLSDNNFRSSAPYWSHNSMNCIEAVNYVRDMNSQIIDNKYSLNAMLFYAGIYTFNSEDREYLLSFQQILGRFQHILKIMINPFHMLIDKKISHDINNIRNKNNDLLAELN